MALFQKNPYNTEDNKPLYTLGLQKTVLMVGLGNIGKEYDGTRHNIGFACIDAYCESAGINNWIEKKDLKCLLASGNAGNTRIIAIKPTTYMNNSGEAVQAVSHFYKIPEDQIIVVHDELDIPFGQIRTRIGGSDAGNNGIKSILQHTDGGFGRMRIGIKAETRMSGADFVLAKFSEEEQKHIPALISETTAMLTEYVYSGQLLAETRSFIV
jgi:peptidyl-tRNA hydrolase, PTH1 family